MHCPNCKSTEVKMVGSVANPSWQCQRCGSTEAPRHAYDAPTEPGPVEGPEFEDGPEFAGWACRAGDIQLDDFPYDTLTANTIAGATTLTAEQAVSLNACSSCGGTVKNRLYLTNLGGEWYCNTCLPPMPGGAPWGKPRG